MIELQSLVGILVQGLRTNLFGLACPFYCQGPSLGLAISSFLLGFLLALALVAWILIRFDFVPITPSSYPSQSPSSANPAPPLGRARAALQGYLHAKPARRVN